MFSRFSRSVAKSALTSARRENFASLKRTILDVLNRQDLSSPNYKIASFNPLHPLENQKFQTRQDQQANFEVTKLKNGITVATESVRFPSVVDLGILLDVGTRDETHESSGALLSIRSTYYKTVLNTNETVNYGMVQMSGGRFNMEYDQENTYFKAHCLAHDTVDIFNMMADCALEPRSVVAANAAMDKITYVHELEDYLGTDRRFNDNLLATAFGNHGLGMPLLGNPHNKKYLSAHVLQKFQLENINPNRIFVVGGGVENHQEFVELVESKLSFIPSVQGSAPQREASEYLGGERRNQTDANEISIGLAFRSAPWTSNDIFALQVLNTLLGSTSAYAIGGTVPRASHTRTSRNLLNKLNYVDSAHAINFNFSDNGLFGLAVTGSASHANELLESTAAELKGLTHGISKEEFASAKATAKHNVLLALERQKDRLEEAAKNVKTFGKVVFEEYVNQIDKVTPDQISNVLGAILSSRPTLVAEGGEANRLPSLDRIENMVKP